MKSSWEKKTGKRTEYAYITVSGFTIGGHLGSGHTDNAGTCSLQALLDGKFQSEIRTEFGEKILEEILAAARERLAE